MEKRNFHLRIAKPEDAEEILKVYAPYVEKTAITFEYEVPSVEEFRGRIENTLQHYPYLVAEDESGILGYAYAGRFQTRAAYDWAVETSIYIRMDQKRHSAGSFAVSVTRGRCNTVRKALLIQKLMEHHALCVIVKKNIIADMFIFFFHFTDSASPQMLRFLYEAVQHLYRCNLFPERVPEYFSPSVLQKLQAFLCRTGSKTSDCSR